MYNNFSLCGAKMIDNTAHTIPIIRHKPFGKRTTILSINNIIAICNFYGKIKKAAIKENFDCGL
jgi:hypothetical protein